MTDLFGKPTFDEGETHQEAMQALRCSAVDQLGELYHKAQTRADRRPDDDEAGRSAARAKAAWLSLRDYNQARSPEEVAAKANGLNPSEKNTHDPDNGELFG